MQNYYNRKEGMAILRELLLILVFTRMLLGQLGEGSYFLLEMLLFFLFLLLFAISAIGKYATTTKTH